MPYTYISHDSVIDFGGLVFKCTTIIKSILDIYIILQIKLILTNSLNSKQCIKISCWAIVIWEIESLTNTNTERKGNGHTNTHMLRNTHSPSERERERVCVCVWSLYTHQRARSIFGSLPKFIGFLVLKHWYWPKIGSFYNTRKYFIFSIYFTSLTRCVTKCQLAKLWMIDI